MDFLKMKYYFLIFNQIIIRLISETLKCKSCTLSTFIIIIIIINILREEQSAPLIIT